MQITHDSGDAPEIVGILARNASVTRIAATARCDTPPARRRGECVLRRAPGVGGPQHVLYVTEKEAVAAVGALSREVGAPAAALPDLRAARRVARPPPDAPLVPTRVASASPPLHTHPTARRRASDVRSQSDGAGRVPVGLTASQLSRWRPRADAISRVCTELCALDQPVDDPPGALPADSAPDRAAKRTTASAIVQADGGVQTCQSVTVR